MVSTRFEESETSLEGWDTCTLVATLEGKLGADSIRAAAQSIIDAVPALMREYVEKPGRMFPVQLELHDGTRLSEHAFWNMLIDACEEAKELVCRYVHALGEHCPEARWGREFPWNTPQLPAGSVPLYVLIDRLEIRSVLRDQDNLPLLDAYLLYLEHCDLDHEVYQDQYLDKLLESHLTTLDPERHIKLLHHRLTHGQWGLSCKDFNYLNLYIGHKFLKPLLDFHMTCWQQNDRLSGDPWGLDDYQLLLAAVYGSNLEETEDVIAYVEANSSRQLDRLLSRQAQRRVDEMRANCDNYRERVRPKEGYIDSGFHRYNLYTKVWERYLR